MSMGTYACYAETVEDSFVVGQCPKEFQALIEVLTKHGVSLIDLGNAESNGDIEEELVLATGLDDKDIGSILDAYKTLCDAFVESTGLELNINYHDKDDRGDEVDGYFWQVTGVYILSPGGEKYKDKIRRKFWTVYG